MSDRSSSSRPKSSPPPRAPSAASRAPSRPAAQRPASAAPVLHPPGRPVPVPPTGLPNDVPIGIAVNSSGQDGGTVTARRAGGLRDLGMEVNPRKVGVNAALQHLAKAVNIAFQTDYGENYLESVYQAAIVRRGEVHIVHREYFGFGDGWFGQFGRLLRSLSLSIQGPDPASPEGRQWIAEKGPSSIRGILNLFGRKLDLVAEYEDRVPAYVEQMFDRLEGSGIILGWDRGDWEIRTTSIGLDIRIAPKSGSARN